MVYDAIIIGGGACGLMCAVQAAQRGKKVMIVEKNNQLGAKILISGGGRCNFTNLYSSEKNFVGQDPAFAKAVFSQWTVKDTIRFFEANGIVGEEKTLGQLFPVQKKAKDVVAVFEKKLAHYSVPVLLQSTAIQVEKKIDYFVIHCENGAKQPRQFESKKVVFASGGLPIPKLGASDFALRAARQWNIPVEETRPALVPLTITGKDAEWFAALAGNTVFCRVSNERIQFEENILFTHWGLSGPAILQISSYWRAGETLVLDLLPGQAMHKLIQQERELGGRRLLIQLLEDHFTKKFSSALGKFLPVDTKIASLGKKQAQLVQDTIHHFIVKPAGDKGYEKAEVMRGGIATRTLHPQTLESKDYPGVYFGGECVDITGWLGGYNFQWAWASGYAISRAI